MTLSEQVDKKFDEIFGMITRASLEDRKDLRDERFMAATRRLNECAEAVLEILGSVDEDGDDEQEPYFSREEAAAQDADNAFADRAAARDE